jgi:signal transduction histidine kinase/ActR/RegA family two-component response regulator
VQELAEIEVALRCVAALADPRRRADAARAIAREHGADDLIVFVRDEAIGRALPATGFPQTLRGGRAWRALTDRAVEHGSADAIIDEQPVHAAGAADGTVLALLGGAPHGTELLRALLPLLGALFRMESIAQRAEAESVLARQSAAQSSELAAKLDLTRADLQRALAVAETATRARDEFLATVSHELRTPLTSMIGWIHLLRDEKDAEVFAEGLETIERNARAQSRLIEDILDFSRINAGKLRLDVRPIELVDVIDAAVEVVRPAAEAKGVNLDCVLDPNAGVVSGDPDRLQQVAWNLLSNAVKFTPRGGRVQVRLARVRSHAEITVSDTGEGIPSNFLPFVFDRFSQADSTSTRAHGGLGLGLGIVRHLIELHGGSVQAHSTGIGHGAKFTVRLPLIVALHREGTNVIREIEPEPLRESEHREPPVDLDGISVLVVEDNDDARMLLMTILKRSNASVAVAPNVPAALELLAAQPPDLVISDIEMPGEDGYSLIRKLRMLPPPRCRIPAIALTAYTRSVDRIRALAAGFQMHMVKPVEPAELVAAVKSLLSTIEARSQNASRT